MPQQLQAQPTRYAAFAIAVLIHIQTRRLVWAAFVGMLLCILMAVGIPCMHCAVSEYTIDHDAPSARLTPTWVFSLPYSMHQ
jgi:hypothetical protein